MHDKKMDEMAEYAGLDEETRLWWEDKPHQVLGDLYRKAQMVPRLVAALKRAEQLAAVASDWNLDEVEIDGEMIRTMALHREFKDLIAEAEKLG